MSTYIPYLSSSPPPLESRQSFDEEDFGNFSRAGYAADDEQNNASESTKADDLKYSLNKIYATVQENSDELNIRTQPQLTNHVGSNLTDVDSSKISNDVTCGSSVDVGHTHNSSPVGENVSVADCYSFNGPASIRNCHEGERQEDDDAPAVGEKANSFVDENYDPTLRKSDGCDNVSSDGDDWADFASAPSDLATDCSYAPKDEVRTNFSESHHEPEDNSNVVGTSDSPGNMEEVRTQQVGSCPEEMSCSVSDHRELDDEEARSSPCATEVISSPTNSALELKVDTTAVQEIASVCTDLKSGTDFEPNFTADNATSNSDDEWNTDFSVKMPFTDSHSASDCKSDGKTSHFISDDSLHEEAVQQLADNVCGESDDDEFADFVCPTDDEFSLPAKPVSDGVWPPLSSEDPEETFQSNFNASFNDEFGTFSSASSLLQSLPQEQVNAKNSEDVICTSFPTHSTSIFEENDIQELESILNQNDCSSSLPADLWHRLCDFEKTNALTYHWSSSTTNKKLLKALHIDSRNLLFGHNWNSSIPIFAANLSFNPLEPIKTPWKSEEKAEPALHLTEQISKAVNSDDVKKVIPPAQFDWNSSGLINPLDAANNSSSLLDLDYFYSSETSTPTKPVASATWSLENELLGPNADNQDLQSSQPCSKISPLLEQILSNAKLSANSAFKAKENTVASEEAERVIRRLPDLNFMQAKVLMFPVRSASP